jgi:hypothetical protein
MAEIAVEKRAKVPWWVWMVAVLLILAFVWIITAGRDTVNTAENVPVTGGIPMAAPVVPTTVTSLSSFYTVTDPVPYTGRTVEITEPVRVLSAPSDRTFWVGEDTGRRVLVAMDQPHNVTEGQTVRLWGEGRRYPGFEEASRTWGVNPGMRADFDNQQLYIHANRLETVSRP